MKYYYERYSVCGLMPNGKWYRFATEAEYKEAYENW